MVTLRNRVAFRNGPIRPDREPLPLDNTFPFRTNGHTFPGHRSTFQKMRGLRPSSPNRRLYRATIRPAEQDSHSRDQWMSTGPGARVIYAITYVWSTGAPPFFPVGPEAGGGIMAGIMTNPLSVVIITRDAETVLEPCLASADFADEILIVDSGSRDRTLEIAHNHGARIIRQEWLGYGAQKQFAVERAAHPWVLCLDADERVSEPLRREIIAVLAASDRFAYRMPRRNRFLGRWLRHGEGYPDRSLRLFHRHHGHWSDDPVHEKVLADTPVGDLRGDLLHESEQTLEQYLQKQGRYTTLLAERMVADGKRPGPLRAPVSALARFLKFYLLRLGFLDGFPGLLHIAIGCRNSYEKHAKARRLWAERDQDGIGGSSRDR